MTIATNALLEALLQQNGDAREIGKGKFTFNRHTPVAQKVADEVIFDVYKVKE